MVLWRNAHWHASTSRSGRRTRNRWYWHDSCGARRFLGAARRRVVNTIETRGLPGTVQYVRSGNLHMLEITPQKGWVHLTPMHRVIKAYKKGDKYHIILIMEWEIDQASAAAQLREALSHVAAEFAGPKTGVLEVREVQSNHVCVLRPDQEFFLGCINNIMYLRMNHPDALHFSLPEPSISM